jgi:pescadillo protein
MTLKKNVVKALKKGPAKNYISRSQALKKLQISIADFRRLCILKGIYPRDPKNKKKLSVSGNTNVTYYWVKDIQFLLHEPLLVKLRETKAFAKKISKYLGRRDMAKVESLREHLQPTYSLDHLIKERYPTFADALRDLDDALSMLYLFAALPNTNSMIKDKLTSLIGKEQANFAQTSAVLLREFEAYLIAEGCVKRAFVSIKGIYYQAEISGQTVTWIVPHERTCPVPSDVDFRVMHTFLEFYHTLLGFVNFKLFSRLGWSYPLAPNKLRRSEREDESEQYRPVLLKEDLPAFETAATAGNDLFANFSVFLSREVPRHSLALLVQTHGGRVGWEDMGDEGSSPFAVDSPQITHQIVDRPALAQMYADRVYIQPQWVYDCINAKKLLDPLQYRIGAVLPPHLSPFVEAAESEDEEDDSGAEAAEEMSVEQKKLAVSMLSKKKKKLYDSLQRGIDAKSAEKARLAQRRAELESAQGAADARAEA